MKRRIFVLALSVISIVLITIFSFFLVLFFWPTWIINPTNIEYGLKEAGIFKSFEWRKARINIEWDKWNNRRFYGELSDFCIDYENRSMKVETCLENISWDASFIFSFKDGFKMITNRPVLVRSKKLMFESKVVKEISKTESRPPDIWEYWKLLWSNIIPDLDIEFEKIVFNREQDPIEFDLSLKKDKTHLIVKSLKYSLHATQKGFELHAPEKILLPENNDKVGPFYLYDVKLKGEVYPDKIPLELKGAYEIVEFTVNARLDLPLKSSFDSINLRKKFLSTLKAKAIIPSFKNGFRKFSPDKYKELPAPFNVLEGQISFEAHGEELPGDKVLFNGILNIDLVGKKQVLNLDISSGAPINIKTMSVETINVGLDFNRVSILLPRLSKRSPPPQFFPDKRFKTKTAKKEKPADRAKVDVHLEALNKKSLHFKTNLLDEPLRLNFDLKIAENNLQSGFFEVLPLETTLFKRPINLLNLKIVFDHPEEPFIEGKINFPLPEYKITLDFEGSLSSPIHSFSSDPPLPQNDIYAVLLFGRPMSELNPDDKSSAGRTNQLLAQGILSLSVLYFLAGSPVEYVGFDPDSKEASAQIGLDSKTSLRVGGGQEGLNSSAIRRSLGKGWYLDTSVQNNPTPARSEVKDYGVLLERIIAY